MQGQRFFRCDAGMLQWELSALADSASAVLEAVNALDADEGVRMAMHENRDPKIRALWQAVVLMADKNFEAVDDLQYRAERWAEAGAYPNENTEETLEDYLERLKSGEVVR